MKICPNCHKELPHNASNASFCGFCGYKFEQPKEKPKQNKPQKTPGKKKSKGKIIGIIVLAVLLVICLAAGGIFLYMRKPVHITKEDPNRIIYDGEIGTIKIKSLKYGKVNNNYSYIVTLDTYNKTHTNILLFFSDKDTYVDSTAVNTYYIDEFIPPYDKRDMKVFIRDRDIEAQNAENFEKIVTELVVKNVYDGELVLTIPIEIDRDAFE